MGCDIHGAIEVQFEDGKWRRMCSVDHERFYLWFAIIANVKNVDDKWECRTAYRGIPNDADPITLQDYENGKEDYHSVTWLSHEELGLAWMRLVDTIVNGNKEQDDLQTFVSEALREPEKIQWNIAYEGGDTLSKQLPCKEAIEENIGYRVVRLPKTFGQSVIFDFDGYRFKSLRLVVWFDN